MYVFCIKRQRYLTVCRQARKTLSSLEGIRGKIRRVSCHQESYLKEKEVQEGERVQLGLPRVKGECISAAMAETVAGISLL